MTDRRFKELTLENWLEPDPVTRLFVGFSPDEPPRPMTGDDWARQILAIHLSDAVPEEVHRLFEVACGAILYGYFFYPLYTLGLEQMPRVAEAAVAHRCANVGAPPSVDRFARRLTWLRDQGVLSDDEHARWNVVRDFRNLASHPQDQTIVTPGMAINIAHGIVGLINSLFA